MKSLALAGGDLVVGAAGHETITGTRRVRQELSLHLGEDYGMDRFHPEMGSVLIEYIGEPIDADTEMLVRAEVGRVVQQYIGIQSREVLRDHLAQRQSRFDASDVVIGVKAINAKVDYDTIRVAVSLVTQSGAQVQVNRTVLS